MPQEKIHLHGYEITATVLRGPYSTLYRGMAQDTQQPIFIRNWPTAQITSERKRQRLQDEVDKLKLLNEHPHILDTYNLVIEQPGMALVSEATLLGSLQDRLEDSEQAPFSQQEVFAIIEQIGDALVAAHEQGVAHANVTPHAIFFRQEGEVALADFRLRNISGAIKEYHAYIEEAVPRIWYMAPEQFDGRISQSSDQYALACIAYKLLTGRVPFAGTARATLLQKHKNETPQFPSRVQPDLPAYVDVALMRALEKDTSRRFPDMRSFLATLKGEEAGASLILPAAVPGAPGEPTQAFAALPPVSGEIETGAIQAHSSPVPLSDVADRQEKKLSKRKLLLSVLLPLLALLIIVAAFLSLPRSELPPLLQAAQPDGVVTRRASTPTPVITRGTPSPTAQPSPTRRPSPTTMPTPTPTAQTAPIKVAPGQMAVSPIFECVQPYGNRYDAYFGYNNPSSNTVTIPQGSMNQMFPGQYNGGQPTVFNPGRQYHVFRVTFYNGDIVAWMLNNKTRTASQNGPGC
ncbi:hypothetical protein KSC_021560 [Ktedonobacter sp. SOSP1-52]|uniref:serine/threonine protein kinase n=1 Tax=Ktedonobacter sp. SOSP1-52 TaxID=2778366 RepID=UPI00191538DE|nr:serine/threonine-protein kinase [Ktedonobacter sp. SOSP1-52]GHO63264.1 hypothetical protein KSC_021560 [Ktedonobacter sp. SOSP1-52]